MLRLVGGIPIFREYKNNFSSFSFSFSFPKEHEECYTTHTHTCHTAVTDLNYHTNPFHKLQNKKLNTYLNTISRETSIFKRKEKKKNQK
jgi:hypothetical protein